MISESPSTDKHISASEKEYVEDSLGSSVKVVSVSKLKFCFCFNI